MERMADRTGTGNGFEFQKVFRYFAVMVGCMVGSLTQTSLGQSERVTSEYRYIGDGCNEMELVLGFGHQVTISTQKIEYTEYTENQTTPLPSLRYRTGVTCVMNVKPAPDNGGVLITFTTIATVNGEDYMNVKLPGLSRFVQTGKGSFKNGSLMYIDTDTVGGVLTWHARNRPSAFVDLPGITAVLTAFKHSCQGAKSGPATDCFRCKVGANEIPRYINSTFVCNKDVNCPDGADERNCVPGEDTQSPGRSWTEITYITIAAVGVGAAVCFLVFLIFYCEPIHERLFPRNEPWVRYVATRESSSRSSISSEAASEARRRSGGKRQIPRIIIQSPSSEGPSLVGTTSGVGSRQPSTSYGSAHSSPRKSSIGRRHRPQRMYYLKSPSQSSTSYGDAEERSSSPEGMVLFQNW